MSDKKELEVEEVWFVSLFMDIVHHGRGKHVWKHDLLLKKQLPEKFSPLINMSSFKEVLCTFDSNHHV